MKRVGLYRSIPTLPKGWHANAATTKVVAANKAKWEKDKAAK